MRPSLTRTIWKGISLDLPSDWELTAISHTNQTERLTFADRFYERLRLTWRPVPHEPDLRAIIDNQIQKDSSEGVEKLRNLPGSWTGALIPKDPIRFTYAACFLPTPRLLMEAVIVWPQERDKTLESSILSSIAPAGDKNKIQSWQAMGMDIKVPETYKLLKWQAMVGRVEWQFSIPHLKESAFTLRRIAMPDHWLKEPLEKWLANQYEKGTQKEPAEQIRWNKHPAWRIAGMGPANPLQRLLGREPSRLDLTWECPTERRVHHLTWTWRGVAKHPELPDDISVTCCNPPSPAHYVLSQPDNASPQSSLQSIVYRNEAMTTEPRPDGGLAVSVPLKQPRALKPPLSWILPYSSSRRVAIDPLGKELLDLCDGHRTVEAIIIAFAEDHLLTFREASLPVVRQLLSLSERGIVALVGNPQIDDKSQPIG